MDNKSKSLRRTLFIITFTLLLAFALYHISEMFALLRQGLLFLSPLLSGFCVAFLMNILLRPLEAFWTRTWKRVNNARARRKKPLRRWPARFKRPLCLLLSFVLVIGALFAIVFIVIPELQQTITQLINAVPAYLSQINGVWERLRAFAAGYEVTLPALNLSPEDIKARLQALSDSGNITSLLGSALNTTLNVTYSIFSSVFSFVVDGLMTVIFSLYMLAQKEKLSGQLKRLLYAVLPGEKGEKVQRILSMVGQSFTNYVTGQLTEAIILGGLCFIGMSLFAIPYALVVAVLVGVTALIPVVGAFIGTAVGAFLILLVSPAKALMFVIFIIILQQLENNLIYPRVVGKSVGLPGLWVLAAVTVGGSAFGVVGMLISVPCCAVLYSLTRQYVYHREKSA